MSEDPAESELEQLTTLALSVLSSLEPSDPNLRLFPGKIPEKIPLEIPVPPQSRLFGTVARNDTLFVITLQSDLTLNELVSFYRAHLTTLTWYEADHLQRTSLGGFVSRENRPVMSLTFCHPSSSACLRLGVVQHENGTSAVRLDLSLGEENNLCINRGQPEAGGRPVRRAITQAPLPVLTPPPDTQEGGSGAGGSPRGHYRTLMLTSSLAPEALAQHYAEQLTRADWRQTGSGDGGPLVWSTWQFTSAGQEPIQWSGLFFLLKTPEEVDHYFLYLHATWPKAESDR